MALRINHNTAALNALRNLNQTDGELSESLERLSSGLRVNRAADGPATLVISEQMRGQIASIDQAIRNSEASISMVQTAEAALNEVNTLLTSMRQLAIHAANEGANDERMLAADQAEIENALQSIDRIARTSQFGTRTLLDGSNGANGTAVGEGLEFVAAEPITKSSPANGYPVEVTRHATRAEKIGQRAVTFDDLINGFEVMVSESGRTASFSTDNNDDRELLEGILSDYKRLQRGELDSSQFDPQARLEDAREIISQSLQRKADQNGLEVNVLLTDDGVLGVRHRDFGAQPTFFVASNRPGVLPGAAGAFEEAERGRDVEGTINGKRALGEGELLHGAESTETEGLTVRANASRTVRVELDRLADQQVVSSLRSNPGNLSVLSSRLADKGVDTEDLEQSRLVSLEEAGNGQTLVAQVEAPSERNPDGPEGYVHVTQNSLTFQVGPTRGQTVNISLLDAKTDRLANGVDNDSGFTSLQEIDVTDPQGAQDAILLIDKAINEISTLRADLGAFQKNTLETNTNSLRVAHENLTNAESSLRDADMAEEMSNFTRNQIMFSSGIAMLAQANQTPRSVLQLLGSNAQ